jgi:hypothetical protein
MFMGWFVLACSLTKRIRNDLFGLEMLLQMGILPMSCAELDMQRSFS